jgi:hypothetical protein
LAFYGRLFDFKLRGKSSTSAFIDLGDQFLALQKGRKQPADYGRHFELVVDDKEAVRKALADAGIKPLPGRFLDFLDPWGNRIEIVAYDNIQFTKAPNVLSGMGLGHLSKNAQAIKELTDKGMAPNQDSGSRCASIMSKPFATKDSPCYSDLRWTPVRIKTRDLTKAAGRLLSPLRTCRRMHQ